MKRLNMVLADSDEGYIEALGRYIRASCALKFNINVFSRESHLLDYLGKNTEPVDILMAGADFLSDKLKGYGSGRLIVLSDGRIQPELEQYTCIYKYQPGDRILDCVINLFSDSLVDMDAVVKGNRKTGVVMFYSPQGGSGKTVISYTTAVGLAQRGLTVLYLNLESFCSQALCFTSAESGSSISKVFFHLKQQPKNLAAKLKAAVSTDSETGVSYFAPPDNALDLDELTESDVERLIATLRALGQWDIIAVDTDSSFNRINLAVLQNSDLIVSTLVKDGVGLHKHRLFFSHLKKLTGWNDTELGNRICVLANRMPQVDFNMEFAGRSRVFFVPDRREIFSLSARGGVSGLDNRVNTYLEALTNHIVERVIGD